MRFGLIGTGGIGHIRAQALNGMKNCELSAVTDVVKERARALASSFSNKISVLLCSDDEYGDLHRRTRRKAAPQI